MDNQNGQRFLLDPNIEQTMCEETLNASNVSMQEQDTKYKDMNNQYVRRFLLDPNIEQTMCEETLNASNVSMQEQDTKYKDMNNQYVRRFLLDPNIEQTMCEETLNASNVSMQEQETKYKDNQHGRRRLLDPNIEQTMFEENSQLQLSLSEERNEVAVLDADVQRLSKVESEFSTLSARYTLLEEECKTLSENLNSERESKNVEINFLKEHFNKLSVERQLLQSESGQLQALLSEEKNKVDVLDADVQRLSKVESEFSTLSARYTLLEEECKTLSENLNSERESKNVEINFLKEHFNKLSVERQLLQSENGQLQALLSEEKNKVDVLDADVQRLSKVESEFSTLSARYTLLEEECKTLSENLNSERESKNVEINFLKEHFNKLSVERQLLQSENGQLQALLSEEKNKVDVLDADVQRLSKVESEFSTLSVKCASLEAELHSTMQNWQISCSVGAKKCAEAEALKSKLDEMNARVVDLVTENGRLNGVLNRESEEFDKIENDLRSKLFDMKREHVLLKLKFKCISETEACKELGFDVCKLYSN